jgi:phosphoglycerate dehydrogenase-like enzyme
VIKEDDLVEALESGKGESLSILGIMSDLPLAHSLLVVTRAALDVFENEPEIHPKLMTNPNVVSDHATAFVQRDLPHISFQSL